MDKKLDEQLLSWASPRQAEFLKAVNEEGSWSGAARVLGTDFKTVKRSMDRLRARAALQGYSPEHHLTRPVAPGQVLRGTSQLYRRGEAEPVLEWVKTRLDMDQVEAMMRATADAMAADLPRMPATPAPSHGNADLCNMFVITDYHLGALSWHEETGADWDIRIAEDLIMKWFERAISLAPDADTAVFAQLSDFLHADGIEALTPASKHLLDVDSRFAKVVRVAIRILRRVIAMLLEKHKRVHIVMADANHDPVSQIWLREWFAAIYENEPRITVDQSPSPYNAFEFGKVALFMHHGHKRKVTNVSEVFAAQFREMFGRTKYAYAHMGHLHSVDVKENNLMIVEQHRTLTAPDAYAARGGWMSGRDAQVITYHREYGEVSRVKINSDMLRSKIAA